MLRFIGAFGWKKTHLWGNFEHEEIGHGPKIDLKFSSQKKKRDVDFLVEQEG